MRRGGRAGWVGRAAMHLGVLRDLLAEEGGEVLLGVRDHHVDEHALETVGERHELRLVVVLAVLRVGATEGDADEAREELVQHEVVVLRRGWEGEEGEVSGRREGGVWGDDVSQGSRLGAHRLRRLLRPRRGKVRREAVGELGERPLLDGARLREQRVLRLLLGLRLYRRVAALALALLERLRRVRRVRLREHVGERGEVDELRLELRVFDEVVELLELHFERVCGGKEERGEKGQRQGAGHFGVREQAPCVPAAESMPEMPLVYFEKIRWRTPKCFCRQSCTPCSHSG